MSCSGRVTFRRALVFTGVAGLLLIPTPVGAHESTLPHFLLAQALPSSVPAHAGPVAPLTIELRDDDVGAPIAGLVRISSIESGQSVDLPAHLRRPMGWYSLPAGSTVDVPTGEVRIEACNGLETEITTISHDVATASAAPTRVSIRLRRFYAPADRRLVAANTHLHLRLNSAAAMGGAALRDRRDAEAYLVALGKSDGLDLVCVSHLVRPSEDRTYISNEFTREDFQRLSDERLRLFNGEEHRHEGGRSPRRGGPDELRYGHVLFLDLPQRVEPVSYGAIFSSDTRGGDGQPMRRAIVEARGQHATVIWCHGKQGTEDVPNWIAGVLDAQNIFDGGNEGSFENVFYPYLNAGFRVPFSTGTDWGCYDFSRVYVPLHDAASAREFLRELAAGRSFITNGTFLEFDVDGRTSGDTLELPRAGAVRLRARGIGRDDFARIEVVFNGSVVAHVGSHREEGHFVAELDAPFEIREPGWLALRIPMDRPYTDRAQYTGPGANLFGKALFAHTSPVYVKLGGEGIRQPAAIHLLLADLETSMRTIESKGAFANDTERDALLTIYRDAAANLRARLLPASPR